MLLLDAVDVAVGSGEVAILGGRGSYVGIILGVVRAALLEILNNNNIQIIIG